MNIFREPFRWFFALSTLGYLFAQITVSGTVTDASTGETLAGANVVVDGTSKGTAADASGSFTLINVPNGSSLTASMIGYSDVSMDASRTLNFQLSPSAVEMSGLYCFCDDGYLYEFLVIVGLELHCPNVR